MAGTDLDVLLVGVDAACLPVLHRPERTDSIPNPASLLAEGTSDLWADDPLDREQSDAPGAGVEAHLANLGYLD